ncbi:MAG: hypothetical protein JO301_11420 [Chitinophagaceae bacterium]|nr:hypothetical protein [Chitinophagaceae bacterium]
MYAENHPASNIAALKYELSYQQQLLYFRKRAGATGKELSTIGLRITRLGLMIILATRLPASWHPDGTERFTSSRS